MTFALHAYKLLRFVATIVVFGLFQALLPQPARAAVTTWGNSAIDWNTASNWSGGVPTSSLIAGFNTNGSYGVNMPVLSSAGAAAGVWDTGSGTLTIGGSPLTIAGTTINGSSVTEGIEMDAGAGNLTLSSSILLTTAQWWVNNSTVGTLTATCGTVNNNGLSLTIGGSGNTTIGDPIIGSGGLTMGGLGMLTLNGTNSFTGQALVAAGTLSVPTGGVLSNSDGLIVVSSTGASAATFAMSGGSVATGTSGDLDLGSNVSGKTTQPGTANISGGTLSVGRNINVGDYSAGTFNQTGGFVTGTSPINVSIQAGGGTMNLSGGTLNLALSGDNGNLYNGYHASGAVNISGSAYVRVPTFNMGRASSFSSASIFNVLSLNGGTLSTNSIVNNGGGVDTNTVYFNGGLLQASSVSTTFLTGMNNAYVMGGGAVVDTAGYSITIGQNLLYGLSGGSIDGGLTVISSSGAGMLTLTGSNNFIGPTTVSGGTLTLGSGAALASTTINVSAGGAFNALSGSSLPSALNLGASGTINLNGSAVTVLNGLNGPSTAVIGLNGTALTVNNSGSFAGSLQDNGSPGSLIYSGSLLTLNGNNTYSGGTTFSGGTLQVGTGGNAGSLGLGPVSINGLLAINRSDTGASALAVPGLISGSGSVVLNGAGSVTFYGANTYTGKTTINAGTLIVNGSHAGGDAYTVASGATLAGSGTILSGTNSITLLHGANIAPGSNVTTGGVGTLALPNLSIAGGGTAYFDLSNSLNAGNDLVQVNGPLAFSGSTTVVINSYQGSLASGDYPLFDYAGALTHSASSLVLAPLASPRQTGHIDYTTIPGEVLLDITGVAANLTWVGGTHGGFTNTWVQNSTSNTAWSGGNFFAVGDNVTFDATAGANTTVTVSGAVSPGSVAVNGSNSYTFTGSGLISGAAALTVNMQGPASLTLANSGGNNFSGGTFLQSGTVVLGSNNALSSAGTLTLGSAGGTGVLDMASHSQQFAGLGTDPNATAANQVIGNSVVSSTSTLTYSGSGAPASYFGGSIQDGINGSGGQVALTVAGGLLNLSGSNTYSGPTTIASGGTLQLGSPTALYAGAATNNAVLNGVLDLGGNSAGVNALSGSGTIANSGAGNTLVVGNSNASSTFTGTLQDEYSYLTKTGSGTLVLTGQNMSTVTAPINQGVLQVTNSAALGAGYYVIASGAKLYLNYPAAVTPNWASFSGSGTLELNSAQAVNGSALWVPANSSLNLLFNFSGTLQVDNGRVQGTPNDLGSATNVVINNGAQFLAYDGTTSGTAYNFPQNFSISGLGWGEAGQNLGALRVWGMNATISGNVTLTGNSALYAQNAAGTALTVSGGISGNYNLTINDSFTTYPITLSGSNTYTGTTTVGVGVLDLANSAALLNSTLASGGITFDASVGGNFTFGGLSGSGNIALIDTASNAVALSVGNNNTSTTYSGQFSGPGSLAWIGSGALTVAGNNNYAGGTTISSGTLQVGNGGNSGTLGSGNITNNGLLALNRSDAALVIPAAISGSGGVAVNGSGAVTLSGSNTYGGTTAVIGALIVNGTHAGGGAYTIAGGATLAGSGTISGGNSVTLAAGANLSPGSNVTTGSVGTLTLPGLSLAGGGTAYFDLSNSPAGSNDLVRVNGPLTLGGSTTIAVNLTNAALGAGDYALFDYSGPLSYSASATALVLAAGATSPRQTAHFDYGTPGVVSLDVTGGPLNLTWLGGTQGGFTNTWVQNVTSNTVWSAGNYFASGDNVTFNASAGTNTAVTISGTVSPSSLTVSGSAAYTFSGPGSIAGATSLVMNGPGSLTLNSSNAYSGGTSLAGGLLNLGNSAALGSPGAPGLTISGGSLDNSSGTAMSLAGNIAQNWNGSFTFLGSNALDAGSGAVTLGASPTVTVAAGTLTEGGAISGSGYALTKNGSGTLVLGGSNTFSGGTTLSNGVLVLNNNYALGSGPLTISGGTLDSTAGGVALANNAQNWNADFTFLGTQALTTGTGTVTLSSSRTVTVTANTLTVGGPIADGGNNYSLTKAGAGALVLTAANTYGGPTIISGGTLQIGAGGSGGAAGSLSPNSPITDNGGLGFSRLDTMTQGVDFSGSAITGSGSLIQFGPGAVILTASNTYSGPTIISGGTLQIGNSSAGAAVASPTVSNSGTLIFSPSDMPTYGGAISGNGAVTLSGPGMLTLSGSNTFTGALTVSMGTLAIPPGAVVNNNDGSVFVGNGLLVLAGGQITTGSTGDVKVGYSSAGTLTVSSGTLSVGRNLNVGNPIGSSSGVFNQTGGFVTAVSPVNLAFQAGAGGGTMNLSGGVFTLALSGENGNLYNGYAASSTVNISGSAYANIPIFNMGRATVINSAAISNVLNLNGGTLAATEIVNNGNGLDNNTVNFNGGLLQATAASATFLTGMTNAYVLAGGAVINDGGFAITIAQNLQSGVSPGADGGLSKSGSGTLTLDGANTYTGSTTVQQGVLQLGNASALGAGGLAANGGTLDLEGYSVTVPSFSGAAGTVTDYGTGGGTTTLTVAQSTTTAFGGQIVNGPTNLLALSLTGPGTLILSPGAPGNSYTGGTTVDSGTLVLESPTSLADGSSLTVGQGASALFAPAAGPADHEYMVPAAPVGAAAVPERGTLVLLAFGLGVGAACRRFSRRSTVASSSTRV